MQIVFSELELSLMLTSSCVAAKPVSRSKTADAHTQLISQIYECQSVEQNENNWRNV